MKAVKGNREYDAKEESTQDYFQKKGFDIVDDEGNIVKYGKGKTVSYEQYAAAVDELNTLKAACHENTSKVPDELTGMSVDELKAYAEDNGIDIGRASTADGIIEKIKAAPKE